VIATGRSPLEALLSARVVELDRRPLVAHSSHRLEELDVTLEDGTSLELVLKHLGRDGMLAEALTTRPQFLADSWREAVVYTDLLGDAQRGTARCYGILNEPGDGASLVLERVAGPDLSGVTLAKWIEAARWLGSFHAELRPLLAGLPRRLLRYDVPAMARWMDRAIGFASDGDRATLEWLATRHASALECLAAVPTTVLHGDFHASNVLVVEGAGGLRVCPVDWELAGVGPGPIDLAALTAGGWTDHQRQALARAYLVASGDLYGAEPCIDRLLTAGRLQLAVQWLGWSPGWRPPAEHRQDWLAEAVNCAEELD